MSYIFLFSVFISVIVAWAFLFPHQAYWLLSVLEHGWRRYLIRRGGERLAKEFFRDFQHEAITMGIDMRAISATIQANREEMINELGSAAIEEVFGPPETLL